MAEAVASGKRTRPSGASAFEGLLPLVALGGAFALGMGRLYGGNFITTLAENVALLLLIGALIKWARERCPGYPVSLLEILLGLTAIQPAALILAILLEGDVVYVTDIAVFSHFERAERVAAVAGLFCLAAVCGWLIAARRVRTPRTTWREILARVPRRFSRFVAVLLAAVAVAKLVLLFPESLPAALGWALRLYVGFLQGMTILLGAYLRGGDLLNAWVAIGLAGVSGLSLVAGNRTDAILFIALVGYGFAIARPLRRLTLLLLGGGALGAAIFFLWFGETLRESDSLGRSGEAAISRLSNIGETADLSSFREAGTSGGVRRLLRNGSHAVISSVPDRLPFEQDGLVGIPLEMARRFLPKFRFEGISDSEDELRNIFLAQLGFRISWSTSVELALVPDAWLRGGWFGVVLIGLGVGAILRVVQDGLERILRRDPTGILALVIIVPAMFLIEGRDFVWGLRSLAQYLAVALVLFFAQGVSLRRRYGAARGASVGLAPSAVPPSSP